MLQVVCLNVQNYCGQGGAYVNNLRRAVARHLSLPHEFVCFCDGATPTAEYDQEVTIVQRLPPDLKGWWAKLALFRDGTFAAGDRILYVDLDSLITGSLDDIASYAGRFALIEDLMFPGQWGSGVMAWEAGFGHEEIWLPFAADPQLHIARAGVLGDQGYLMSVLEPYDADILQDLYPNQIASYKVAGGLLAPQTRICCFHGRPRPHEVTEGWPQALWVGSTTPVANGPVSVLRGT